MENITFDTLKSEHPEGIKKILEKVPDYDVNGKPLKVLIEKSYEKLYAKPDNEAMKSLFNIKLKQALACGDACSKPRPIPTTPTPSQSTPASQTEEVEPMTTEEIMDMIDALEMSLEQVGDPDELDAIISIIEGLKLTIED